MSKVEIIGRKSDFYSVISILHSIGCVEIEDIKKELVPGDPTLRPLEPEDTALKEKQELEEVLVRTNSILSIYEAKARMSKPENKLVEQFWSLPTEELIEKARELLETIDAETRKTTETLTGYESELSLLKNFEVVVLKVEPLVRHFSGVRGYETLAILVERRYRSVIDLIYEELRKLLGDNFEIATADVDEKTTAALIFYPENYSAPVHSLLWEQNVNEIKLPKDFADMPFDKAVKKIKERINELPGKIKELRQELDEKSKKWVDELRAINYVIENRLQEYQVIEKVGQTEFAFVIIGWTPRKYLPALRQAIAKKFSKRVIVNELELSDEEREEAPVCMENPVWAKAYEAVLRMWSLPKYGTFDPTPMVGFFSALFFGVILGDVGYGLLLLLASLWLIRVSRERIGLRAIGFMFVNASVMVILFGFLFGEFFGDLGLKLHLVRHFHFEIGSMELSLPLERDKPQFIIPLLILSLSLGITQIILGQVIGIINGIRERSRRHIMEKVGMLLLFGSIILIAAIALEAIPGILGPLSVLALLAAFGLIAYGGGVIGVVHIFSTLGKIFSYLRLMALGLAGVILAIAANKIGSTLGNIWIGIAVASIFHLINLVVHSFSSTIHSLRLNLIEFFDQFYEPGGREFKPFQKTGG